MGYKTFEDMKRDIPEGATHYQDETLCFNFSWFNMDTGMRYFSGQWHPYSFDGYPMEIIKPIPFEIETESPQEREALDMIDATSKQLESLTNDSESPNGTKYNRTVGGPVKLSLPEWDGEGLPHVGCVVLGSFHYDKDTAKEWRIDFISESVGVYTIVDTGEQYTFATRDVVFHKPESPEQKSEREREECIHSMVDDFNEQDIDYNYRGQVAKVCAALYDAGYRKAAHLKEGE